MFLAILTMLLAGGDAPAAQGSARPSAVAAKKICKRAATTESRMGAKRVCKTAAQWKRDNVQVGESDDAALAAKSRRAD